MPDLLVQLVPPACIRLSCQRFDLHLQRCHLQARTKHGDGISRREEEGGVEEEREKKQQQICMSRLLFGFSKLPDGYLLLAALVAGWVYSDHCSVCSICEHRVNCARANSSRRAPLLRHRHKAPSTRNTKYEQSSPSTPKKSWTDEMKGELKREIVEERT